jgi:protein-L-isoaspartate(D-aspartate) O-methyltransferase
LARHVWSVEVVEEFGAEAQTLLRTLGHENVTVRIGDGSRGWPEHAPFDCILVTAAAERMPQALVQQLKPGGRMVLPVGPAEMQHLTLVEKSASGSVSERGIIPVRFTQLEIA